jgi:hypothetical protein
MPLVEKMYQRFSVRAASVSWILNQVESEGTCTRPRPRGPMSVPIITIRVPIPRNERTDNRNNGTDPADSAYRYPRKRAADNHSKAMRVRMRCGNKRARMNPVEVAKRRTAAIGSCVFVYARMKFART